MPFAEAGAVHDVPQPKRFAGTLKRAEDLATHGRATSRDRARAPAATVGEPVRRRPLEFYIPKLLSGTCGGLVEQPSGGKLPLNSSKTTGFSRFQAPWRGTHRVYVIRTPRLSSAVLGWQPIWADSRRYGYVPQDGGVRMRLVRIRLLGSAVLIAALLPGLHGTSHAQEARGTITGTVLDSSKGVLPGAQVTVTNVSMGTDVSVITNDEGFFQATYLIPGTYRISVELSGFRTLVREGIEVRVGDRLQFELALEVGGAAEEVTVTAASPLLETSSGSLGQVIDARRVAELPIPHGDAFALIGLAGGTAFQRSSRLDRPFEPTHIVGYTMNGTRANRSDVTIDGIPSSATAGNGEITASFVPPRVSSRNSRSKRPRSTHLWGTPKGASRIWC